MSNMEVGMENLPNVYVESIRVDGNTILGGSSSNFIVRVSMKDQTPRTLWSASGQLFDRIKLKFVFFYSLFEDNPIRRQALSAGFNKGIARLEEYGVDLSTFTSDKQANPNNATDLSYYVKTVYFRREDSTIKDGLVTFYADVEFNTNVPVTNATVYVAPYYEFEAGTISNQYFSKYYGPATSEKIVANSTVYDKSGYFTFADTGQIYMGPVHEHEGNYMEGSRHTPVPHRNLNFIETRNNKIFSNALPIPSLHGLYSSPTKKNYGTVNVFSQTDDNQVVALLHLDLVNLIISQSTIAKYIKNLNPVLLSKINMSSALQNVIITRVLTESNGSVNNTEILKVTPSNGIVYKTERRIFNITPQGGNDGQDQPITQLTLDFNTKDVQNDNPDIIETFNPDNITRNFYDESVFVSSAFKTSFLDDNNILTLLIQDQLSTATTSNQSVHYKAEVSIKDPFIKYYKDIQNEVAQAISGLDLFQQRVTLLNAWSHVDQEYSSSFKRRIAEELNIEYSNSPAIIANSQSISNSVFYRSAIAYYNALSLFGEVDKALIVRSIIDMLVPFSSGSSFNNIGMVIHAMRAIISNLDTAFAYSGASGMNVFANMFATSFNSTGGTMASNNVSGNSLSITGDKFYLQNTNSGYKIFSPNTKVGTAGRNALKNRIDYEQRYYRNLRTSSKLLSTLPPEDVSLFQNISKTKEQFFTALSIKNGDQNIDLTKSLLAIDSNKLRTFRINKYGITTSDTPNMTDPSTIGNQTYVNADGHVQQQMNSVSVQATSQDAQNAFLLDRDSTLNSESRRADQTFTRTQQTMSGDNTIAMDTSDVADIAATNSAESDFMANVTADVAVDVGANLFQDILLDFMAADFPFSQSELLITNSNSRIHLAYDDGSVDLELLPPHYKALMVSNYASVDYDPFSNINLKRTLAETQMNIFKIKCLTGYQVDSNGYINYSSPIYEELTEELMSRNKPFFCQAEPYNLKQYKFYNDDITPIILNNILYVQGTIINTRQLDPVTDANSYDFNQNKRYYTSNIIKQDQTKDGVMSLINPSSKPSRRVEGDVAPLSGQQSRQTYRPRRTPSTGGGGGATGGGGGTTSGGGY